MLIRLLSIMWLWFGVGKKILLVAAGILPSAASAGAKSSEDACVVHVPAPGLFGSGHCVVIAELTVVFQLYAAVRQKCRT